MRFRWAGIEALVGSGGLHLIPRYSNVTLIACKPWAFRPVRGWLPYVSVLLYVAAEMDRWVELHPGGRGLLPSPALEHLLLGLLIHTKNPVFLLSAWFSYCHWLLFKSLGSRNPVLQPVLLLPPSCCFQLLLFIKEQCVYIHSCVLSSWRDFWHLENRAF